MEYKTALELFSIQDFFECRNDTERVEWKEGLDSVYKKSIQYYKSKSNKKYNMVLEAYKILDSLYKNKTSKREKFENVEHANMFNGLLPKNYNPELYNRDTSRPAIKPDDFITNPDDFNAVFDYNMEKFKKMNTNIKLFDKNDTFAQFNRNVDNEEYSSVYPQQEFVFENKKLEKNVYYPELNEKKSKLLQEREQLDKELF